jgi:WS/DGAT/MGAT family acyltransferase
MATREREFRFEQKMTDAEAMMWNVEKDPWLSSCFGTVTILDRPVDVALFKRRIAAAVADIPRLRERVAPVLGRFTPPVWEPDPEFRLDYHIRRIGLAVPASERDLYDLVSNLLEDPLDRTRPLWVFYCIEGLDGGRGALFAKMHHTITDGEGGVRLAERYMEVERDAPPPPDVDIEALGKREERPNGEDGFADSLGRTVGHTLRRGLGIAKRALGDAALAAVDPLRIADVAANVAGSVRSARSQLGGGESGSEPWRDRSRHRHLEVLEIGFDEARLAAKALGGSLNDFFVTGATLGAIGYHEKLGSSAEHFTVTFVVSTREDSSAGGNSFTPSMIRVPAGPMSVQERFDAIRDAMGSRRSEVTGAGLMSAVSGLANLLPTSVVTGIARSQAGRVDFATSNVRAAPFDLFISGAKVLAPYPMGPVAGTAWNITLMSYAGSLFMGVNIDPVAVSNPALLRASLEDGFRELIQSGGER